MLAPRPRKVWTPGPSPKGTLTAPSRITPFTVAVGEGLTRWMLSLDIPGLSRSYQLKNQVPPAGTAAATRLGLGRASAASGPPPRRASTDRAGSASRGSHDLRAIRPLIVQVAGPDRN